jgi:hypothetical protein
MERALPRTKQRIVLQPIYGCRLVSDNFSYDLTAHAGHFYSTDYMRGGNNLQHASSGDLPMKFRWLIPLFLCSLSWAAGGSCPSGANYTNPANPTGALVTLSSLGITSCYYVANSGSNSNNGTSESTPFLYGPGMQNCSGNCSAGLLAPGIGIIVHGGDTFSFGNSGATHYAGVVSTCADNGNNAAGLCLDDINGTLANPIYYGVDPTWPASGWTRPILTADNPLCGPGHSPGGCTNNSSNSCSPGAGASCTGVYYMASCAYQVGNTNNIVDVGFAEYIWLDNFEITGLCQSHTGQPGGFDTFVNYSADNDPIYITNLYIHGATHLQFASPNGQAGCNAGTVCINVNALDGNVSAAATGGTGETIALNVVDFADSDPVGENLTQSGFYNVSYNVFRYFTQGLPSTLHLMHDNLFEYYNGNGHSNLIESAERASNNAIYNNVFRHLQLSPNADGGVVLWFGPVASGTTDYIFNNLVYDVGAAEYLNMGGVGLTTNNGKYTWFNNTFQTNANQNIATCGTPLGTTLLTNNFYIDDGSAYEGGCSFTKTTELTETNATATSNGYVSPNYAPTSGSSPTVGQGTNETSGYIAALTTAGLTAAATAAGSDMTYACSYAGSGATPVCPARTVVPRPSSGAWDIGAYEFAASANAVDSISGVIFSGAKLQ